MEDKKNTLLKDLIQEIENEENDEIINKLSFKVLKETPNDLEIEETLIISYIKINKLEEALKVISDSKHSKSHEKLRAYILYKKGSFKQSLDICKDSKDEYNLLLQGQNYLKLEKIDDSYKCFKDLYTSSEEKEEIAVNMMATLSKNALTDLQEVDNGNIEFLFNKALLQCFHLQKAEAKETLNNSQEDQTESDRILSHLLLDYITLHSDESGSKSQEMKEINEKYSKFVQNSNEIESSVKSILFNNSLVVKSNLGAHMTFNEGLKLIDEAIKNSSKLSSQQILSLRLNKLIYCLVRNKIPDCLKLLEELEKSENEENLLGNQLYILLKSYLMFKNKGLASVMTYLQELILKSKDKEKYFIHLLKCELSKKSNKTFGDSLISLIDAFPDVMQKKEFQTYFWNVMSANEDIFKMMEKQIDKMLETAKDPLILKKASEYKMESGEYEKAAEILSKTLSENATGKDSNFYDYIYALSKSGDLKSAEALLSKAEFPALLSNTEVEKLEADLKSVKISSKAEEATNNESKEKKKKRKRKGKLPKDFDPEVKPDPERWLPKYERSKFKKMYKKKGFKGSQGESTGQETVQTFKQGPSTSNTDAATNKKNKDKKRRKK